LIRLVDLGVERYLVASTVEAVLAQRLVRRACSACAQPYTLTVEERLALSIPLDEKMEARKGVGCPECRGTGYVGRTGIFELLVMDDDLREALDRDAGAGPLTKLAQEKGMKLLYEDG